jgi:hypothetical protein
MESTSVAGKSPSEPASLPYQGCGGIAPCYKVERGTILQTCSLRQALRGAGARACTTQ